MASDLSVIRYSSPFSRIRTLLLLILLVFLTTVGLALFSHSFMKEHMLRQQLNATQDILSTVVSSSITPWVATRLHYLDTLSNDSALHGAIHSGNFPPELLNRWQALLDFTDDVFFVYFGNSATGEVTFLPDDTPLPRDFNMYERPWYKKAMEDPGEVGWTDLYQEIITSTPQISAVIAVSDLENSSHLGVMAIDVSLGQLQRILKNVELPAGAELVLFDRHQQAITASTPVPRYEHLWAEHLPFAQNDYLTAPGGTVVFLSSMDIPETGWRLVLFTPHHSFYEPIYPLRNAGIAVGLLVLVLSLIVLLRFLRALSRRTSNLARYFQEATCDAFVPRRIITGDDEFAILNDQFNSVICERKRAEEALAESRRQLSSLMSNLPGIAYRCRNDEHWTMEFVSEGCQELTGYAAGDLVLNRVISFNDIIHPGERDAISRKWSDVLKERGVFRHEYRITTADKQERWVWEQGRGVYDSQGNLVALEGFITDVSARKEAEKILLEFNQQLSKRVEAEVRSRTQSETNFQVLFEKSPEGILILSEQGIFVECNPMGAHILGYTPEEIIGRSPAEISPDQQPLLSESSGQKMFGILQQAFCQEMTRFEWVHLHKLGAEVILEVVLTPITRGECRELLVVWRDMTEVYRLQQEREQQCAIVIQQAKMAELGSMIGAIAHQWNQPLSTISVIAQGVVDMYEHDELSHGELSDSIATILQQIAFMGQTIEDFRTFFIPSRQAVAFDVVASVVQVQNLLKLRLMNQNITVRVENSASQLAIGYPGEFKQVVLNLINNACDAFDERHVAQPEILVRVSLDGPRVAVAVCDNGGGIPEELLPEKLFEAFISSKGEKGSGIGLWMSRLIVEKMHGSIRAFNEGDGACFEIRLPGQLSPVQGQADPLSAVEE